MKSEWRKYYISDVVEFLTHKRRPITSLDRDKRQGKYPYYGASGIIDHIDGYIFDGAFLLVSEDGENLRTRNTPIAFKATGKFSVNNHAHILAEKEEGILDYLEYYFSKFDITPYITGAVQPRLNKSDLDSIEINIPPKCERLAINNILNSFTNKIELNRQINKTLEQITQAVFKSWFVDSEPTRAKQRLEDIIELAYGKALVKTDRIEGEYPVYGSGGLIGTHESYLVEGPGIIVGRKGSVGTLYWEDHPFSPIDTVFYVKCKEGMPLVYLYYLLQTLGLESLNTGSAVPGLNRNNIYSLEVPKMPEYLITKFTTFASSIIEKIKMNSVEIKLLEQLRDTLLPKLMSGKSSTDDA